MLVALKANQYINLSFQSKDISLTLVCNRFHIAGINCERSAIKKLLNVPFILTMMTSSNENLFRVTGLFAGNSPVTGDGHRWNLLTKASEAGLWCFLWSKPWINGWVNNREPGDLRRHCPHYEVNLIQCGHLNDWCFVGFCLIHTSWRVKLFRS